MKTRKKTDDSGRHTRVHGVRSKCGKLAYSSKKFAKGLARQQSIETGELIAAYHCLRCHCWHLGHPPGSRTEAQTAWDDVAATP